jgi:hypothetical protein
VTMNSIAITPQTVATEVKRVIWNAAVDKAQEIVSEWMANGRDPETLFDQLQDLKIWTRNELPPPGGS